MARPDRAHRVGLLASLKLGKWVKENRSPSCCSDECCVEGTKAGFELHLESGNLRLHSSSNRLCQPISSGQEPGCSKGLSCVCSEIKIVLLKTLWNNLKKRPHQHEVG